MSDAELRSPRSNPYGDGYRIGARNSIAMCGHRVGVCQAGCRTVAGLVANVGLGLVLGFYRASSFDPFHLLSTAVTYSAGTFGSGSPFLDAFPILVTAGQPTLPADPLTLGILGWIWRVRVGNGGGRGRCGRGLGDCGCRCRWRRRSSRCDGWWSRESG